MCGIKDEQEASCMEATAKYILAARLADEEETD